MTHEDVDDAERERASYDKWRKSPCVCPVADRRECIEIRYFNHDDDDPDVFTNDPCECLCHDEYEVAARENQKTRTI